MYNIYKSDFTNQVHQLNFSISQNYHLLKNNEIKYEVRKFDINWKNYEKTGKRHLINFLIRDHFSNCFYAEIHPIDNIPNIFEFLYNAWKKKENYEFSGMPKNIIVGKHIIEKYPEIKSIEKRHDINIELAKNGFATGIRSLRDWERNIRYYTFFENYGFLEGFQKNTEIICRDLNLKDSGKTEPNLIKWINSKSDIGLEYPKEVFFNYM